MRMFPFFCIAVLLLLNGCAGSLSGHGAAPKAFPQGTPVVHIHPLNGAAYRQASVGVLSLQVPPELVQEQGLRMAALFKDVLLGKRLFPVVRQIPVAYGDLDEAVALGRRNGVDLVLAGQITRVLEGTELGGARLDLAVRLLDTRSGQTVWYIEEGVDQPLDYPDLGFWQRLRSAASIEPVRPSAGAPAIPNLLARIAWDMAEVMAGARQLP